MNMREMYDKESALMMPGNHDRERARMQMNECDQNILVGILKLRIRQAVMEFR